MLGVQLGGITQDSVLFPDQLGFNFFSLTAAEHLISRNLWDRQYIRQVKPFNATSLPTWSQLCLHVWGCYWV